MLNRTLLSWIGAFAILAAAPVSPAQSQDMADRFASDMDARFGQAIRVKYKVNHQDFIWTRIREQYEKDGTVPEGWATSNGQGISKGWSTSNGQAMYGEEWLYKINPGGGEILKYSEVLMPLDPRKHPDLITSQTLTVFFNGQDSYILSEARTKSGAMKRRLSVSPGNYLNTHFAGSLRYTILGGLCVAQGQDQPIPVSQALLRAGAPAVQLETDGKVRMKGLPSSAGEKVDILAREAVGGFEIIEVAKSYEGTDYRTDVVVHEQRRDSRGLSFPDRATLTVGRPGDPSRITTIEVLDLQAIPPDEREAEFTLVPPEGTLPGANESTREPLRSVPAAIRLVP